jgi:hypothetical protein
MRVFNQDNAQCKDSSPPPFHFNGQGEPTQVTGLIGNFLPKLNAISHFLAHIQVLQLTKVVTHL